MRCVLLVACVLSLTAVDSAAQEAGPSEPGSLGWYLPSGARYAADFPTPEQTLGWEVGTWHARHDQLVSWFETVAKASPRVQLETYGRTHEQRPLLMATISSEANLARIDQIREAHVAAVLSGAEQSEGPAVVWMGYSVHGNESSGSNAAMLLAYHLAAAQGADIERFLESTVVLIDPCLNPDGLDRFAHWANSHKGRNLVGDPSHREHLEAWPGGRGNHYWFDLNRDWLLGTHPESRGRLAKFHAWLPSVLTDYHEMGSDSTYFFQPGIPSRQNPLTPEANLELTRAIARFHAEALDDLGSLYYTEESFDDFYYGKGSTYPDLNGGVGILFEQASARGHARENDHGGITFPFAIRNQFTTSLSSLRAVDRMRAELSAYQREFFRTALELAARHPVRAYVFGAPEDPERTFRLADLLRAHNIRVHRLGVGLEPQDDPGFTPGSAYLVPLDQPQHRLIRALFEQRTSWEDNTFYDVSSWTLPLSFNVPFRALDLEFFRQELVGELWTGDALPGGEVQAAEAPVAWIFEWHPAGAPRALARLLAAKVRARVATRPFKATTPGGPREFDRGTIVIPLGIQEVDAQVIERAITAAAGDGLRVWAATSGLTPDGVDLGSGSLRPLVSPRVALVVGRGVSSTESGEVWFYLDQRLDMPVSLVEKDRLGGLDLHRYTHILAVSGATAGLDEGTQERLNTWVKAGGVLIATKGSAVWAAEKFLGQAPDTDESPSEEQPQPEAEPTPAYGDYEQLRAVDRIAGAIFEARLDLTHPLAFGFAREHLPVFRNSTVLLPEGADPFGTPLRYRKSPLLAGYCSKVNLERLSASPGLRAGRVGAGAVICLIDDPLFRGVWYGTEKLMANALFFGAALKHTGPIGKQVEEEDQQGH
jgi:Zinc carboxypeptidase